MWVDGWYNQSPISINIIKDCEQQSMGEAKRYGENTIEILLFLSDGQGHAQWEISKHIKMAMSNTSNLVRELLEDGIIYKGAPRKTTNLLSKHPRAEETPLYINKDLSVYRRILMIINDMVEEAISNIIMATRNEELARRHIIFEKNKLCLIKKGPLTPDDYEKLSEKFEDMKKFRGKDITFYINERDKYMDCLEKFLSSTYTEEIIKEFGFDDVLRNGVTGSLDVWYMSRIAEIALNKNLIDKNRADEVFSTMEKTKDYQLPIIRNRRIRCRFANGD